MLFQPEHIPHTYSHTEKSHQRGSPPAPSAVLKLLSYSLRFSNQRCGGSSSKSSARPRGAGRFGPIYCANLGEQQQDTLSPVIWEDSQRNTSSLLLARVFFLARCLLARAGSDRYANLKKKYPRSYAVLSIRRAQHFGVESTTCTIKRLMPSGSTNTPGTNILRVEMNLKAS